MRIGELAVRTGASPRSLRYYEQHGLLAARRNPSGQREYDETDLRLVHQIRTLLDIGFGLEETRPFVECLRSGHDTGDACPSSVAVYRRKLAEVEECLAELTAVRAHLRVRLARVGAPASAVDEEDQEWPCRPEPG